MCSTSQSSAQPGRDCGSSSPDGVNFSPSLSDYYAKPRRGPQRIGPWREKGFLDRWGCGPYRAIQGAFRTAHWPFMRPSLHSSWGGDICMHNRVPGYKGKCPHSCRWQLGGLDDLVRKTPCVGESDNMGPTDMRSPL